MRQTIYGETHNKTSLYDRQNFESFFDENKEKFRKIKDSKTLYQQGFTVSDSVLNYLNIPEHIETHSQLKKLISTEFESLERIYPFVGDIFVNHLFNEESVKKEENFLLSKQTFYSNIVESIKDDHVKQIISKIVENINLEYSVEPEYYYGREVVLRKLNNLFIKLEYDFSYIGRKNSHEMNNFKFILIDGYIESVGEIHHLMHQASQNKLPYVIFCFGVSPEVKNVIIENNRKGITEVFPVDITFNEETINVMSDLATLFNEEVISASKGQTISQAVRKNLKSGKKIVFHKNGLSIEPLVSEKILAKHRSFLRQRIIDSKHDKNRELLATRLKSFSTKILKIYIPEELKKDQQFRRQLDYGLNIIANSSKVFTKVSIDDNRFVCIPQICVKSYESKSKNLKKMISNIDKLILTIK